MRTPFWLLNCILLLIMLGTVTFMWVSRTPLPEQTEIVPVITGRAISAARSQVNIDKIYENDLFGTYVRQVVTPTAAGVDVVPEPPMPEPIVIPQEPAPQFLEPLPITLRGIMMVITDETKSRVIIADNKTNQEGSFKVGDRIEDAQLMRIMSNKIIFLRANGQQEVLYLREKDAKNDPTYAIIEGWTSVIRMQDPYRYEVNVYEFLKRIQGLAQFIDMLDLTTTYRAGESFGVRIGAAGPQSLAHALGMQKGDIITSIGGISTAKTADRMHIYQMITQMPFGQPIMVTFMRSGQEMNIAYLLVQPEEIISLSEQQAERRQKSQADRLQEKEQFAPTVQQMRARERKNMMERSKRSTQNVVSQMTE